MPLTPGRLTSKIRQLGPSSGFLSKNFSAVSKPSDRNPADFSSPCIDARMLASSSTTNTVAVFAGVIARSARRTYDFRRLTLVLVIIRIILIVVIEFPLQIRVCPTCANGFDMLFERYIECRGRREQPLFQEL